MLFGVVYNGCYELLMRHQEVLSFGVLAGFLVFFGFLGLLGLSGTLGLGFCKGAVTMAFGVSLDERV